MNRKIMAIIILFLLLPIPVLASSMDAGEEIIAGGLNKWVKSQADNAMGSDFGVTTGNLSNTNVTPSQRLIYNLDTYELDPYSVGWIKQTVIDDYSTFILVGLLILILLACLYYFQIIDSSMVGEATEFLYGHEKYFNYHEYLTTFTKLVFFPIALPFILIFSMNFEQTLSSGIMSDALQYISFSSDNITLYLIQAVAYTLDSLFIFARILVINEVCAKVMLIALFVCVPWGFIKNIEIGILIYFYTALFMRPILLLITTMAAKQVFGLTPVESVAFGAHIYAIRLLLGFMACILGILGPFMYILWNTVIGVYFRRGLRRISHD